MKYSAEESDSARPTPRETSQPTPDRSAGGTILVVDDEPMVVRAAAQILSRAGFTVITADGPLDAEARFEAAPGPIRLLLTDVVMPDGGGRRLAERLVARSPSLRVLFMSGFTEHDSVRDERALPAPLITKPFSASKLGAAVSDVLAGL